MTGDDLKDAKEELGQNKQPLVAIELSDEGAKKFADLTSKNIGRRIAITLDGKELTNPVVQQAITGGKATISGSQSLEEAKIILDDVDYIAVTYAPGLIGALLVGISLVTAKPPKEVTDRFFEAV